MGEQPKFRTDYVIPDDCEICNGPKRPSNTHNFMAHVRAAHPRREAVEALRLMNDVADAGGGVDYGELRRFLL